MKIWNKLQVKFWVYKEFIVYVLKHHWIEKGLQLVDAKNMR